MFTDGESSQPKPPTPPKPQPPQSELCNCGVAQHSASGNRIIGGDKASENEYPWQAYLVIKKHNGKKISCGGSLISNQHILTAAHCTEHASEGGISAFLGEHDIRYKLGHDVTISKVTDHPDYNPSNLDNDLSILTLASAVTFSPSVLPVCLPGYVNKSYQGEVATVTGWGNTISGDDRSGAFVLQEVNVTVWSNFQCRKAWMNHGRIQR